MSGIGEVPGSPALPGARHLVDPRVIPLWVHRADVWAALGGLTLIPGAAAEAVCLSARFQSVVQSSGHRPFLPLDRPRASPSSAACLTATFGAPACGAAVRTARDGLLASRTPRHGDQHAPTSDVGFCPAMGPNTSIEEEAQEDPHPWASCRTCCTWRRARFVEQPGWRDLGWNPGPAHGLPFHNEALPGSQGGPETQGDPEDTEGGPALSLGEASGRCWTY